MIWCVEDDASIRDIEVYTLTSMGFEARGFDDGVSFWSALQTQKPDLVVLDVMLPGVDGIELLQRMKASAELRTIPVVMATAKGAAQALGLPTGSIGSMFPTVGRSALSALRSEISRFPLLR